MQNLSVSVGNGVILNKSGILKAGLRDLLPVQEGPGTPAGMNVAGEVIAKEIESVQNGLVLV